MSKAKRVFRCRNCGVQSPKWSGQCPSCQEWNTLEEALDASTKEDKPDRRKASGDLIHGQGEVLPIDQIELVEQWRIPVPDGELHRVLGGGLVPGGLTLLGGEPGIGKSTLLLQLALRLTNLTTLYVSGEESQQQIRLRAERLGALHPNCLLLCETETTAIFQAIARIQPQLILVDSIQTLFQREMDSAPGTVAQIRQVAGEFMQYAKQYQVPVILVGHVTKDGSLAGPKVLEHLVDTVLQFEGDRHQAYRLLRSLKNRYGATHELGIYQMEREGLREVLNPSDLLMSRHWQNRSGIAIGSTREGNRSLMVEVQALVSPANYGGAQRNTTGFEQRRLQMLLAVLQKRCRLPLAQQDVFLNLAGGLETSDPALDFAVCAAMVSSYLDLPLSNRVCFMAEIGLGGELRPVAGLDARLAEARKLGFDKVVVSSHQGLEPGMEAVNRSQGRQTKGLRVIPMDYISDWTATLRGVQPPSTESTPPT